MKFTQVKKKDVEGNIRDIKDKYNIKKRNDKKFTLANSQKT